jgi:hypothetical protein
LHLIVPLRRITLPPLPLCRFSVPCGSLWQWICFFEGLFEEGFVLFHVHTFGALVGYFFSPAKTAKRNALALLAFFAGYFSSREVRQDREA